MTAAGVEVGGTGHGAGRRDQVVVLCVAAAVLVARLGAALWVGPARRVLDDDEAVYFTAGALVGRGRVPYRDVTFAQPPGIAYLLALPSRWWSVLDAISVARCMSAVAGAACVLLVGRLAVRRYSLTAAVAAMVVMATFPAMAVADRSLLVEPWLNLCTVAAAAVWLRGTGQDNGVPGEGPSSLLAGAVLGMGLVMKWWAVLLLVPMAATLVGRRRSELAKVLAGAATTAGLLLLPVLVVAPADFVQQTVRYQSARRDGLAVLDRVGPVFGLGTSGLALRGVVPTLVALAALVLLLGRRDSDPVLRFGVVWFGVVAAAFLFGPYLGFHYGAHLAPALGLMAAPVVEAAAEEWRAARPGGRTAVVGLGALLLVVVLNDVRWVRGDTVARTVGPVAFAPRLRSARGATWSPSPEIVLLAGRVPGVDRSGRVVVDPLAGTGPGAYRQDAAAGLPAQVEVVVVGPSDELDPAKLRADGLARVAVDPATRTSLWAWSR